MRAETLTPEKGRAGAYTIGEVETDLELEVFRGERGRGLIWGGREGAGVEARD